MRIVRFLAAGSTTPRYGVDHGIDHGEVRVTLADGDPLGVGLTDTQQPAEVARLLTPIEPRAILCIGLNYAAHAAEGGREPPERPVVFVKTPSAAVADGEPIQLPRRLRSERVDYEAELAVVIGKACKNVDRGDALDYVLGYACGNDVSARDWQKKGGGGQWCRGKTFDTFAPVGPAIVTLDELASRGHDPLDLAISCTVSGERMQDSRTRDMIFDVPTLVEFLSASVTLEPGTVIFTGTPQGVGFAKDPPRYLRTGDEVTVEIEGVGRLGNPVIEEQADVLSAWSLPTGKHAG
ncbi:MAG: fumarylacetoacetate hydrolase family protein [Planctomycetota bacterium]